MSKTPDKKDQKEFLENAEKVANAENVVDLKEHVEKKKAKEEKKQEEPEISWEQALEEVSVLSKSIITRQPKVKKLGEGDVQLILPDETKITDLDEYRPMAEKVAEDCEKVKQGDHLVVHQQAQITKVKYRGHVMNVVHEDYVVMVSEN